MSVTRLAVPAQRGAGDQPCLAPLSYGQRRMWLLSQVNASAANLVMAARLTGALNLTALTQAFSDIVARHVVLRSAIVLAGDEPAQIPAPPAPVRVRVVDLTGLRGALRGAAQTSATALLLRAEASRPVDAARPPLIRVTVFVVGAREHLVAVGMHHAATDGWSMGVLAGELSHLYAAYLRGAPAPLRHVPRMQYREFALAQRTRYDGPPESPDSPPALSDRAGDSDHSAGELPLDRPRSPHRSRAADTVVAVLPPRLTNDLADLRRRDGGSLFMLLVAALVTLLHRLSGREDVAVGALSAGRTRPELEPLIGYFANVLPLRLRVRSGLPFRELWRQVREQCAAAYAAQDRPYELSGQPSGGDRGHLVDPALSVLCVLQQADPQFRLTGLRVEPVDVPHPIAQFDLTVEVRELSGTLRLALQYDTSVLRRATVELFSRYLRSALEQITADPDLACGRIPLGAPAPASTNPQARHQVDRADRPDLATLVAAFEARASRTPDAVAVVSGDSAVSYGALNARANRLARRLRDAGVAIEDRVGICLCRSIESAVAMLAVLKAGAAYLPLDPTYPSRRLAEMIDDADAKCVIAAPAMADTFGTLTVVPADLDTQAFATLPTHNLGLPLTAAHLAYVMHTSGSTGRPKGVLGTHGATMLRLGWMWRAHPFAPGERAAQRSALSFVDSVAETFGPLLGGAPVEIIDSDVAADPSRLVLALAERGVTRLLVVPTLLRALLDTSAGIGDRLPALRLCVTSGERLPAELARRHRRSLPGTALVNLFGCTEVAGDATAAVIDDPDAGTIGSAIGGATTVVIERHGATAPALVAGELAIGGPLLARGYHRRPAETAARFRPDPAVRGGRLFHTGDLVRQRADGALAFLGRLDNQVKIRGVRVEPGEVEDALLAHPLVTQAAVTVRKGAVDSQTLVGFVVTSEPTDSSRLRAHLLGVLPPVMVPGLIAVLDGLPHTPSGKVDYRALPHSVALEPGTAGRLPHTASEQVIADIFAELLPARWRGVGDDFFTLGGHSIIAAVLVQRLGQRFDIALTLQDLFAAPTILGLADVIDARRRASTPTEGSAAPNGWSHSAGQGPEQQFEPFPLTEVQQAYWIGRTGDLPLGNVATHAYFEVDVVHLDLPRFESALRRLVNRHPALRAVVLGSGDQRVLRSVPPYPIGVTDLRAADPDHAEAALADVRAAMSHQVLPADRWPLFDIRATLLRGDRARVHVSVDGLIADAYSVHLLTAELGQLYHRPDMALAPLTITFRDVVLAQERARATPAYDAALRYWRERLATLPPAPELPLAAAPESLARPTFRRWARRIDSGTWQAFGERAATEGVTRSAALLTAFAEVLAAWSRRPHFTLMLTMFNRRGEHPDLARVVGDFTSVSPLEVDHRVSGAFRDRARALQERLWADLDHSLVGGVTILREWNRRLGGLPRPLAPVVFTSTLGLPDVATPEIPPLGQLGYGVTQTPQAYLDHQVAEVPDGLLLHVDAVAELFPTGLIDAICDAYERLLHDLASGARAWSAPVRGLLPERQRRRRETINATTRPLPASTLPALVVASAERGPDALAVITTGRRLTYRELTASAGRIANGLRSRGVGRGDVVGVAAAKGWEQAVAALAVVGAGAAYVPLDPDLPAERIRSLAEQTQLRHVLTQHRLADQHPHLWQPATTLAVDDESLWAGEPDRLPAGGDAGDLAYVIFTSGSTGTPKGVMIDHRGAVNTIIDVNDRFGVGAADRVLGLSSLSFDLSVYDLFGAWAAGAAVVLPDAGRSRDPGHWLDLLDRHEVTVWNSVPALMTLAVGQAGVARVVPERAALDPLRLVLLSGDWIPLDLPGRIRAHAPGAMVVSLGGATEASIWSVCYPVADVAPQWSSIPYGRPLANQRLHVLDEHMRPRPDWVPGALYIAGDGLALGYIGDPTRTAEQFRDHPWTGERLYHTGDLARYLPDGDLELLGREDLQVKISGYRVELGEVEAALVGLPGVAGGAVIAVGPRDGDRRLAAFYIAEEGAVVESAQLRDGLRDKLPAYLVPNTLTALASLPLTANGKVDRSALAALVEDSRGAQGATATPVVVDEPLLAGLAQLWSAVLGVDRVAPDDNFFDLGGTSLVAMRLLAALEARTGTRIPLARLYEAPTPSRLAAAIASARARGAAADTLPPLVARPEHEYEPFPLNDIQQAYWLGRHTGLSLGGVATHNYVELDVVGLDVDRVEHALRRLVDRHGALRTVVDAEGTQRVLSNVPAYEIARLDARKDPGALGALRASMSHRVFDLARWPAFDIKASRVDDERTRLHLSVDLMTADAWSFRILQRELLTIYADPDAVLEPIACTFRDYVCAMEQLRDHQVRRRAERYWRARLADLPPAPPLPMAIAAAELTRPRFTRAEARLSRPTWGALRAAAPARNLTPSGLLCAALAEVLAMYGQCGRFTLNVTTFNRLPLHPHIDRIVGDFTTTTLLAVDASASSFTDRAGRLQRQLFDDLQHRHFSGVEVLRLLRADPRRRADALAPVVFTSMLGGEEPSNPSAVPWQAATAYAISQTPQVLLDVQVYEHAGELVYAWDHVAEAFPDGLVATMFDAYGRLLEALTTDGGYWEVPPAWTR